MAKVQWNARGLKSKTFELAVIISKYRPDILLINETWWDKSDDLSRASRILASSGYIIFRNDRNHRSGNDTSHGGCAIFVKEYIPVASVVFYNTEHSEWLGLSIKSSNGNVTIATGYSTPEKPLDLSFLADCFNGPCLLTGDLNCWHPDLSGDITENRAGKDLWSFLTESNATVINGGQPMPTRFQNGIGRQLDIWLCSQSFNSDACEIPFIGEKYGSDHYCTVAEVKINVSTNVSKENLVNQPNRFLFGKANWQKYQVALDNLLVELKPPASGDPSIRIDDYAQNIEKAITKAAATTIPSGPSSKIPKWKINAEIGNALAEKNRLERLLDRNPLLPWLKNEVSRARVHIRKLIGHEIAAENAGLMRRLARELEKASCPGPSSWKSLSDRLGKKKRARTVPCLSNGDRSATNDDEKATMIGKSIAATVAGAPFPPTRRGEKAETQFWHDTESETSKITHLINIPEAQPVKMKTHRLTKMISKLKFKAPGVDNIPNILIKKGGKNLVKHIAKLFNLSLNTGRVPNHWKTAIVIPILKEGKDPSSPSSYRPVSLLPSLAKLLESTMASYLHSKAEALNLLPQHQAGFRRYRSTCDPIFRLTNDIVTAMNQNKRLATVLVDFKAAFDSVWHAGLLAKLSKNFPLWFVRWTADWLRGRHFKARIGNSFSEKFEIKSGAPQGSPFSPILFILFISDLLPGGAMPDDATRSVAVGSYADDIALWASSNNLLVIQKKLQNKLDAVSSWCHKWRLAVNPSKCEVAVFGYTGSRQPHILLTIANTTVQQNKGCKYLGVILSPRLSWDQHLNLVSSKIKWRIGALRVMGRRYRNLESLWIQLVGTYTG